MNLIANTGIQYLTFPIEISKDDNFRMYFHEWFDVEEKQLKLQIAHFFSDHDIWVKKSDLSELGYAVNGKITETWDTIQEEFVADGKKIITIDGEDAKDSGCFQESINRISWEKLENTWLPLPFFLLKGKKSEFGPTNWCRGKLIPTDLNQKSRKYNLLIAFDTRSSFEKDTFENEDLNETPVFTNNYDKSKEYAICNSEYKIVSYCSEAFNCEWVDKFLLHHFHKIDDINDFKGPKPKLDYLAQYKVMSYRKLL